MRKKVVELVKKLLKEGKIKGFLGLRETHGHVQPYLFTKQKELSELSLGDTKKPGDARFPLNKTLIGLAQAAPDATFAVLVRGCDELGLIELFKWKHIGPPTRDADRHRLFCGTGLRLRMRQALPG